MRDSATLKGHFRTETEIVASRYIGDVYREMMLGVMLTAVVAYGLLVTGTMATIAVEGGRAVSWGTFILQLGTVMMFRPMMQTASAGAVRALFFFYAAITGITVGYVGLIFTAASILDVFVMASLAFGGLAVYGHVTKRNLGVFGTFLLQALLMTFVFSLIYAVAAMFPAMATFLPAMNMTLGVVGIFVFSGLTAYESQVLRQNAYRLAEGNTGDRVVSLYVSHGALTMYLNFINLFFSLLRIFGRRR